MKRKTLFIAASLVLTVGVIAIAMNLGNSGDPDASAAAAPPKRDRAAAPGEAFTPAPAAGRTSPRSERQSSDQELIDQYGDARTKLARNVSDNVVGLLDDVVSMGEMMLGGAGPGWNRGDWQVRRMLRGTEIELSPEQQERAQALFADYREREMQRTKDAVERLRKDPVPLMSLLLAGDARSRGELDEAGYAALQQANAESLGDIINPLDRNNFRGGDPLEDESFRSSFEAMLDPEQASAFREARQPQESIEPAEAIEPAEPSRTDITRMPAMALEAADEAIRSTRQMSSGFKQVLEGMGNLGPILEQQVRPREDNE